MFSASEPIAKTFQLNSRSVLRADFNTRAITSNMKRNKLYKLNIMLLMVPTNIEVIKLNTKKNNKVDALLNELLILRTVI